MYASIASRLLGLPATPPPAIEFDDDGGTINLWTLLWTAIAIARGEHHDASLPSVVMDEP